MNDRLRRVLVAVAALFAVVALAVSPVAAPIRELPPNPWKLPAFVVHSTTDKRVVVGPVKEYVAAQRAAGAPMEIHLVDGISHNRTSDFAEALSHAIPWLERVW